MAALHTSSREGVTLKAPEVAALLREWAVISCGSSAPLDL